MFLKFSFINYDTFRECPIRAPTLPEIISRNSEIVTVVEEFIAISSLKLRTTIITHRQNIQATISTIIRIFEVSFLSIGKVSSL